MTLIVDNDAVVASIDMRRLVTSLEAAFRIEARGGAHSVPRINLEAGSRGFLRVMPVVVPELDIMGLKAFNRSPETNGVRYVIALWSVGAGELLALVDASYLTAARTGAVTAVATRAMTANRDVGELGVIGSGLEARTNLEAICAAQPIDRVRAFSPNPERRARFAEEMSARLGIDVVPVPSAREAADAPLVLTATDTGPNGPVALKGEWLRPDAHVSTIGSTMPSLREVDAETFARAGLVVVDTPHAVDESGDLIDAVEQGAWDESAVVELRHLVAGGMPPGTWDGITVFKSVGTGLQDIIAAHAIYRTALDRGLGSTVDFLAEKAFA